MGSENHVGFSFLGVLVFLGGRNQNHFWLEKHGDFGWNHVAFGGAVWTSVWKPEKLRIAL